MRRWIAVATIVVALSPVVRAQPVYFADPDLKAAVEAELGVTNPTAGDMLGLTSLTAPRKSIDDLTGLEYAANLESLSLGINQISNLSPLAGLTNLKGLGLSDNQISNLSPLAGLSGLHVLRLEGNQISDLSPLAGLTNLEILHLEDNQISNLSPLAGLTNLQYLYLDDNQISDLSPLAGLANLEILHLEHNQISNLSPLAGLRKLWELTLTDNQISDISPLTGLTGPSGGEIVLGGNPLSQEACDVHIPQIRATGRRVSYWGCAMVPDVVGMTESEAEAALTGARFEVGRRMWGPSDAPRGTVVEQVPPAARRGRST